MERDSMFMSWSIWLRLQFSLNISGYLIQTPPEFHCSDMEWPPKARVLKDWSSMKFWGKDFGKNSRSGGLFHQ